MRMLSLLIITVLGVAWVPAHAEKSVIGWVEKVRVYPGDLVVKAKIDTGAEHSSLNCLCVTPYVRDGEKWVKFTVTSFEGNTVELERPIHRMAIVKRHFGESQERPVVKLGVCLDGVYREVDVNLVDRSGFNYQMLVGRSFMAGHLLVDPEKKYLKPPRCKDAPQS